MILPDLNLLLYAANQNSPFHAAAAAWWRDCMTGGEPIGLAIPVALGFVRLSTQLAAFSHPLPVTVATALVTEWLTQPQVELLTVGAADFTRALALLNACGTAGNLVSDAVLAAVAISRDAVVYTADTDFTRLKPVKWRNPLAR